MNQAITLQARLHLANHCRREVLAAAAIILISFVFAGFFSYLAYYSSKPSILHVSLAMGVVMLTCAVGALFYSVILKVRVNRDLAEGMLVTAQANILRKYIGQTKGGSVNCLDLDQECPKRKIHVSLQTYKRLAVGDVIEVIYFPYSKVLFSVK